MSYRIGELEVQGKEPSNVVHLVFKTASGAKVGIRATRIAAMPQPDETAPSEYSAPAWDPA
jgi:hypothetical protein